MYIFHVEGMFLKFPFEGKSGKRLNAFWYWRPHFWATQCKEHFPEEELTQGKNKLLEVDSLMG